MRRKTRRARSTLHRHRHDAAHPGELFNSLTGLKLKGVNYKSSADAQTELVAGRLQVMFITVASVAGQLQSGQLRLLGYTNDFRAASSPKRRRWRKRASRAWKANRIWWGFFAPKGTPADIVNKMNEGINEALKDPAVIDLFARSGCVDQRDGRLPSARHRVKTEITTYEKIVKDAGSSSTNADRSRARALRDVLHQMI